MASPSGPIEFLRQSQRHSRIDDRCSFPTLPRATNRSPVLMLPPAMFWTAPTEHLGTAGIALAGGATEKLAVDPVGAVGSVNQAASCDRLPRSQVDVWGEPPVGITSTVRRTRAAATRKSIGFRLTNRYAPGKIRGRQCIGSAGIGE